MTIMRPAPAAWTAWMTAAQEIRVGGGSGIGRISPGGVGLDGNRLTGFYEPLHATQACQGGLQDQGGSIFVLPFGHANRRERLAGCPARGHRLEPWIQYHGRRTGADSQKFTAGQSCHLFLPRQTIR